MGEVIRQGVSTVCVTQMRVIREVPFSHTTAIRNVESRIDVMSLTVEDDGPPDASDRSVVELCVNCSRSRALKQVCGVKVYSAEYCALDESAYTQEVGYNLREIEHLSLVSIKLDCHEQATWETVAVYDG
ncbi:hypothetical protein GOBAR_AA15949 [Gossypium barbadense]|uniref:Uncharacterized protein n=1 Tax=Gossypium barbadense TaxID=3634 RepID=A0A2P5XMX5_GOSBA|nr:hypothetical protein GOBAR_AA15949 [Gossypium barbadense]